MNFGINGKSAKRYKAGNVQRSDGAIVEPDES